MSLMGSVNDRLILRGFLASFAFLFLAKIAGATKEVVIAHAYGVSPVVDAYALGFALANWPVALSVTTVNALLIPVFVGALRDGGKAAGAGPLVAVMGLAGLGVALVVGVVMHFAGALFGLPQEAAQELARQAPGLALMIPPGAMAAVLAARLMAGRRQIPALFEGIPALFLSIAILGFGWMVSVSALLAWVTAAGMLGYFLALVLADPSALRGGVAHRAAAVRAGIVLVVTAQIVFSLGGSLMDQIAAATLSPGDNATLSYANRLLMLATGLGATAIGRAVLPVLSMAETEGQGDALLLRWIKVLLVAGGALALAGWVLSPLVVRVLFQRGAFTEADTQAVTALLRLGLLQLPFYFSSLIVAQGVIVRRRFGLLLLSNGLGVATKLVLVFLFLDRYGVEALMYGTMAMYAVALLALGGGLAMSRGEQQ